MKLTAVLWHEAFLSDSYRKAKRNRLRVVIPLLSLFTVLYMGLFTIQSYGKAIGQIPVFGYVDVGFLTVMSLFPITGVMGVFFMNYTKRMVYPFEDAVIETFGTSYAEATQIAEQSQDAKKMGTAYSQVA